MYRSGQISSQPAFQGDRGSGPRSPDSAMTSGKAQGRRQRLASVPKLLLRTLSGRIRPGRPAPPRHLVPGVVVAVAPGAGWTIHHTAVATAPMASMAVVYAQLHAAHSAVVCCRPATVAVGHPGSLGRGSVHGRARCQRPLRTLEQAEGHLVEPPLHASPATHRAFAWPACQSE